MRVYREITFYYTHEQKAQGFLEKEEYLGLGVTVTSHFKQFIVISLGKKKERKKIDEI